MAAGLDGASGYWRRPTSGTAPSQDRGVSRRRAFALTFSSRRVSSGRLGRKAQSPPSCIRIKGARQNNLKGFDLDLPLGRLIVVTGLSGAGKSSLVFETLHAEGQRRYVETFSAYTRQFLDLLAKPKVDSIENIRPRSPSSQTNTSRPPARPSGR